MAKIKQKTSKTAAKRFKISGTGKIMRRKSHNNHMFFHKSGGQKRALDLAAELSSTEETRVRRMLGLPRKKQKGTGEADASVTSEVRELRKKLKL